jgi:hypothetical protein
MNLVNHDLKTIFIHVLKNGGTFTSNVLKKYANFQNVDPRKNSEYLKKNHFGGLRLSNILEANYTMPNTEGYNRIAFTRNPYTRFVSGFCFITREGRGRGKFDNIDNSTLTNLNVLIQNKNIINEMSYNHTFVTQTKMLYLNGVLQITQLCKFENLNDELQNIFANFNLPLDLNDPELKSNESVKTQSFYEYYDEETFRFVNEWFAEDFANFNYTKFETYQDFVNFYKQ